MILDKFIDKLNSREKAGVLIALICILIVLTDHFVVAPLYREARKTDVEIVNARKELLLNIAVISRGVPPDYAIISPSVEQSASPEEVAREMKDEISDLAKKTGVELPSVEDRAAAGVTSFGKELDVEVSKVETDLASLIKFLGALQNSQGMLRVSRLNLTPGKERNHVKCSILITKLMIPVSQPIAEAKPK